MSTNELEEIQPSDLPLRLGRYELTSLIGNGGMAQVFCAELMGPAGFRKKVAVKLIRAKSLATGDRKHVDLFVREARLGGLLRHPNIVDIYELGEVDGHPFIAMELVEGMTLSDFLRLDRIPPASVVLEIASGITEGLGSAHKLQSKGHPAGLIHRDIKPSNILLSEYGAVKISDFGIAVTLQGELSESTINWKSVPGTLSYMSPEQIRGRALDGRSDIFSLGLVLSELVTMRKLPGKLVYNWVTNSKDHNSLEMPRDHRETILSRLPELLPILERCLQYRPEDRYESADELTKEIDQLRRQYGWFPRLHSWIRKNTVTAGSEKPKPARTLDELPPTTIAAVATPSLSTPQLKTNIARETDTFIGRNKELKNLEELFKTETRLVTVKGTGGAGKTRLSRKFAKKNTEEFDGGTWFVDLTEARSLKGLLHTIAEHLSIPLGKSEASNPIEQVAAALRGRGRLLLVLDNFEQIVEHAEETLAVWLEKAPEACFLVTSREPTRVRGETVLHLKPLSTEEATDLFRIRAQSCGGPLSQEHDTTEAIRQIVEQLDGLPLAIELAAARCKMLSPAQILERLSERFKLLRGGRKSSRNRQTTLQGLFEWSWELLQPWEREALGQLSVFRDGFFVEAAEAVIDLSEWPEAPWSLDVVASLYEKSLLYRWEQSEKPRFGMYLSIRDFADLKLGDRRAAVRTRHAEHYAYLGTEAYLQRLKSKGSQAIRNTLTVELENCLAGASAPSSTPEHHAATAHCILGAAEVFYERGPYGEGIHLLDQGAKLHLNDALQLRLMWKKAQFINAIGETDEARTLFTAVLQDARRHRNRRIEGQVLGAIASAYRAAGDYQKSIDIAQKALSIATTNGDSVLQVTCFAKLGLTHYYRGEHVEALEFWNQAILISEATGLERIGPILNNIGLLHQEQGRLAEAEATLRKAIQGSHNLGNRRNKGIAMTNLAIVYSQLGRTEESYAHYKKALKLTREMGDRDGEAMSLGNIGDLLLSMKDYDEAEIHLRESLALFKDLGRHEGDPIFRASLALLQAQRGDTPAALNSIARAEKDLKGRLPWEMAKLLCKKAKISTIADKTEDAREALQEAKRLAHGLNLLPSSELAALIRETNALLEGTT